MEKYQFTAYAGRCRFSDRNVKQEQGNMNEKILIIPGIVWFFNIFFTMKHKQCPMFIINTNNIDYDEDNSIIRLHFNIFQVIIIKNYYVIRNPESR